MGKTNSAIISYETILNKSPHPSDTKKLLHIIVGAERPLTTDEINIAMHIKICYEGTQTFDDIHLEDSDRYPRMLRNLCGLFIQFVDSKVYLIHQTAKEFLIGTDLEANNPEPGFWKHCLQPSTSQKILAEVCISYLYLKNFDMELEELEGLAGLEIADSEIKKWLNSDLSFQFADYSSNYWMIHSRHVSNLLASANIIRLCSYSHRRAFWLLMWQPFREWISNRRLFQQEMHFSQNKTDFSLWHESTSSLMIASYSGLYDVCKNILLSSNFNRDELEPISGGYSVLGYAIQGDNLDIVCSTVPVGSFN